MLDAEKRSLLERAIEIEGEIILEEVLNIFGPDSYIRVRPAEENGLLGVDVLVNLVDSELPKGLVAALVAARVKVRFEKLMDEYERLQVLRN